MDVLVRVRAPLLALFVALVGCRGPSSPSPTVAAFPDVAVSTLDDRPTHVLQAIGHRPAVVALWATWCDACLREQGALERLSRAAAPRGGVVVGISVGESSESVRASLARRPASYLELVDEPFAVADAVHVRSLPAVMVLDADGRVVHTGGALDPATLAAFRRVLGVE
jgi:thioredoxin-like negative regulator of GroEL